MRTETDSNTRWHTTARGNAWDTNKNVMDYTIHTESSSSTESTLELVEAQVITAGDK